MPSWICCNSCFQSPSADLTLAVTTCGHVVCITCFRKGKEDECLICKTQCQVTLLSDNSSSEVKALFSDISVVATNYFSEISKVLRFQTRHRKRLLAHYQKRIGKLEEHLYMMKQEMQEMNKKMAEQKAYIAKLENELKHQSVKVDIQPHLTSQLNLHHLQTAFSGQQMPVAPLVTQLRQVPSPCLGQPMEVDGLDSFRKPQMVGRPSRLSLINPPGYAQMGTIDSRSFSQSSLMPGPYSYSKPSATASRGEPRELSRAIRSDLSGHSSIQSGRGKSSWQLPGFKLPAPSHHSSMSSLEPHPFSLARVLPK